MSAFAFAMRHGWRGLWLRKGRAVLMMLGVAIGVVTLTLVVSVTRGVAHRVDKTIRSFGPDSLVIAAGSPQTRGPGDERTTTLTPEDVEAIRREVPHVRVMAPMVTRLDQTVIYQGKNTATLVVGSTPDHAEAWDWSVVSGEQLSEAHESSSARVALVGTTVVRDLFGGDDPVGQSIRVGEQAFKVIGVLATRGTTPMGMDFDNRVVVPLSTAMRRLYNVSWYSMVRLRAKDLASLDGVTSRTMRLLRERHHISDGNTDDFAIRSATTFREMAAKTSGMLTMMLMLITAISLFAGAIVLANIMLAAISERRTEIGLLRALGATKRQIVRQFVVEGTVVTLVGGAIGVALGSVLALLLGRVSMLPSKLSWEPFVMAVVVSFVVGVGASFLPARRAAKIEPATALRP